MMPSAFINMPDVRARKRPLLTLIQITSLNVDVVTTPILAETDFAAYDSVLLIFVNDGAFAYTVTLTTGEVTGASDAVIQPSILVPAKVGSTPGQNTYLIGPDNMRKFWTATGIADGGLSAARFLARSLAR